jgi:hypothetical protein
MLSDWSFEILGFRKEFGSVHKISVCHFFFNKKVKGGKTAYYIDKEEVRP